MATERVEWRLAAILLSAALAPGPTVAAEEASWEQLTFASLTLTDEQFLRGDRAAGVPVTLTAELALPERAAERLPAVVLMHGSGGPGSGSLLEWELTLQGMGIATLAPDSYGRRGIRQTRNDQSRLGLLATTYDVYRAVETLASDPRVDPARIAVMGFSRGGSAVLHASMLRFQRLYGPARGRIAAYIPFYPDCGTRLAGELEVADAPIRAFHGAADDWALAAPCRAYTDGLRAAGRDVAMVEYPGAFHGFDLPAPGPPARMGNVQSAAVCRWLEEGGRIIDADTGEPYSWKNPCVKLGVTNGYDGAADAAARTAVRGFLAGLFDLR